MANNQFGRFLELADMQMAAEAFLLQQSDLGLMPTDRETVVTRLTDGNTRASRFTQVQAEMFFDKYSIVDQYRNDPRQPDGTGFSATLFERRTGENAGQMVLSIRSTEFVDDAVRDRKSSNELEIADLGWAFGQIEELDAWYKDVLLAPGGPLVGKSFYVTGYSLGGHLATAFNILRREEAAVSGIPSPIVATYTFNGAGTGQILNGRRLSDLVADFNRIKRDYTASPEWMSLQPAVKNFIHSTAQSRVDAIIAEAVRVEGLDGVANEIFGNATAPLGNQASLDYQIAALLVARDTIGAFASNPPSLGGSIGFTSQLKSAPVSQQFMNVTEIVGMETQGLATSFISNSGIHYGARREVPIEAQPRYRGDYPIQLLEQFSLTKLLVDHPGDNDFGDTHSIVLLIDSLSLMAAFERLDPTFTAETARQVFNAASAARIATVLGTQGNAEGDTLERVLDTLGRLLIGPGAPSTISTISLDGNTWHNEDLREVFHQHLSELSTYISENSFDGKFRVVSLAGLDSRFIASQAEAAGSVGAAWRYALVNLNPFVVEPTTSIAPAQYKDAKYGLFNVAGNPNGLTREYLADRAAMLSWKNLDYTANGQGALHSNRAESYQFVDKTLELRDFISGNDLTIDVLGKQPSLPPNPIKVIFGSEESETFFGNTLFAGDRLYGGGGIDRLVGNGGNDYLEGNGANDTLEGGPGADVLVGGDGDDFLEGGTGFDTYIVGVGQDQIRDQDGSGLVLDASGNRIAGVFVKQGSQYVFKTNTAITATLNSPLTITLENGSSIVIPDFVDGRLGIHLSEHPDPDVPPPNVLPQTNGSDSFSYAFSNQAVTVRGLGGNDLVGVSVVPPGHPLPAQPGSMVEGGAGSDAVSGADGGDRLFGGISSDLNAILDGTAPTIPGLDREVVAGNRGDDLIAGGSGHDWLSGGRGEDEIYGGAGDDVIAGGGQIWTGSFWGSGGYLLPFTNIFDAPALIPGQVLPALQDTLLFNVHLTFQQSDELLLPEVVDAIEAAGRIARGNIAFYDPEEDEDIFVGLSGADFEDATDTIFAGAGDDEVWSGFGDDYVEGEAGADSITGGEGGDSLFGGAGDDMLSGDTDDENVAFEHHGADYLDGGEGNDTLVGHGGADTLFGGDGDDVLRGDADFVPTAFQGDDYLDGEAGNDLLSGHAGNDQLYGGEGNDELQGGLGDDHLDGEAGDDRLVAGAGADHLDGEAGNDALFGDAGADLLIGGEGNDELDGGTEADSLFGDAGIDTLRGGGGDDALTGGAGADILMGGAGDDFYLIGFGDGPDTINDTEDVNRIQFTGVFNPGELTIAQVETGSALTVGYGTDETEVVTIFGGLTGAIREFEFAEGTSYSLKRVLNLAQTGPLSLSAQGANVTLVGGSGNDTLSLETSGTLDGGRGDDMLTGGSQDATLKFSLGDGHDIVQGSAAGATFVFDETVDANNLVFVGPDPADPRVTSPRDLILHHGDAGDSIFLADSPHVVWNLYIAGGVQTNHIALLERSGLALEWIGSSGPETVVATKFDDDLAGQGGADTLEGRAGNDTLTGGSGSDRLIGGDGDDRYVFNDGDGVDIVVDNAGTDTIEFGAGITLANVTAELVNATDGNIYLAVDYAGETVLVRQNFGFETSPGAIEFHFADGNTTLSSVELSSLKLVAPLDFQGTNEAIRIAGSRFDDVLIGSTQDDRLEGGDGDDRIAGDAGSDFIGGGTGDDLLVGNAGDDTLDGGQGGDTYHFRHGMGRDLVIETPGALNTLDLGDFDAGDLAKERLGDDLYLHVNNSREGVQIRNYYDSGASTSSQSWQVRFSNGSTAPLADFLDAISNAELPGDLAERIADYKQRARAFYESTLAGLGYQPFGDGYRLETTATGFSGIPEHRIVTIDIANTPGAAPNIQTLSFNSQDVVVSIQTYPEAGSTTVGFESGGNHPSGGAGATRYFNLQGSQYSGVAYPVGSTVAITGQTVTIDPFTGLPTARPDEFRAYPGGIPAQITQQIVRRDIVADYRVNISEIVLDNTGAGIFTSPFSVILGGDGDEFITSFNDIRVPFQPNWIGEIGFPHAPGSFLYGGAGDDTIRGFWNFFLGNNGDDVLVGGTGNDILEGGGGNDHYVMFSGDGMDTIYDDGATRADMVRENVLELPAPAGSALTVTGVQLLREAPYLDGTPVMSLHSAVDVGWGIPGEGVRIILPHSERNAALGVDYLRFANGELMALEDVAAGVADQDAHQLANDLTLQGEGILYGAGGDDTLRGAGVVIGGAGRDTLVGSAGNDILFGAEAVGSSISNSNLGTLWDEGNNYRGEEGDDTLWATAGSDTFEFDLGDGVDTVVDMHHTDDFGAYGGWFDEQLGMYVDGEAHEPAHQAALAAGQDTLRFGPGISPQDITIRRAPSLTAPGDDLVFAHTSRAAVRFQLWFMTSVAPGAGVSPRNQLSRVEFESDPTIVLDRAAIDDAARHIDGTDFADFLFGLQADEVLSGLAGDDYLSGGPGDDVLDGGAGDDTYFFQPHDGMDVIRESGVGTIDVLSFGSGITPAMLTLGSGSLLIRVGDTGDAIHIEDFDAANGIAAIESFRFETGDTLSLAQLLARGFDIDGSFDDDVLTGTGVQDRMEGFGGDDVLVSGAGDDRLDGGSGDDVLEGGAGSDTYVFSSFSGLDRIDDSGGSSDVLELGAGITTGATTVQLAGSLMRLAFGGSRGEVAIRWRPDEGYGVEAVKFFSGTVWDAATLESMAILAPNAAPLLAHALSDRVAQEDEPFSFQVAADAFLDPGDALGYSALLADGTPLPQWLAFNATAAAFTGTPGNDDVGTVNVRVTARDSGSLSVFDTFQLRVANTNDAPLLASALLDQRAVVGGAFGYTVAAGAFADIDTADTLELTASRSDGSDLPAWLAFDPTSRSFSGTPMPDDIAVVDVRVTAEDSFDLAASDVFRLSVTEPGGDDASGGDISGDEAPGLAVLTGSSLGEDLGAGMSGSASLADRLERDGVRTESEIPEEENRSSEDPGDPLGGTLDAFLVQTSHSDFSEAARELDNSRRSDDVLTAVQIARQWDAVARYGERLALEADENAKGAAAIDWHFGQALLGGGEVGPALGRGGVAGVGQGAASLQVLKGLVEGFQQLRL